MALAGVVFVLSAPEFADVAAALAHRRRRQSCVAIMCNPTQLQLIVIKQRSALLVALELCFDAVAVVHKAREMMSMMHALRWDRS